MPTPVTASAVDTVPAEKTPAEATSVLVLPNVVAASNGTTMVMGTPTVGVSVEGVRVPTPASAGLDVQPAIAKPMTSRPVKGNRNFLVLIASCTSTRKAPGSIVERDRRQGYVPVTRVVRCARHHSP